MTILLESQESSSPVITRAVANGLLKKPFEVYSFSGFERIALRILGHLPKRVAEWVIPRVNSGKSFSQNDVVGLKTSDLVKNRISDYRDITGKIPAIVVGIGMGGTTAHLALSLGAPFLPQAFVLTLKNGTMNGNVNEYCALTRDTAKTITHNNPDLMTIQHYDPVHDGWLVKRVNHLRLKLIDLPEEYKAFMREKLLPGADVVYLEGKAQWKRFRLGQNNVFQVGGWGDIPADEFLYGSQRLTDFAKKEHLDFSHWMLDGYPLEMGPESEWGSEAGLGEALESFCKKEGFNFVKISYSDPNNFSKLAFLAKKDMLNKKNIEPAGVVIEMFSQFETTIIDQSALLPLWLIFNTTDSKEFLLGMKTEFPKDKPVFFSGLATFSNTPDIVPWSDWEQALKDFNIINIGARKNHFPSDTLALLDWKKPLEKWESNNNIHFVCRISGNELKKLSEKIREDY
jgi:hypothetical protein